MSLPSSLSTRTARAADPALTTFPVGFIDLSGTGAGPYVPAHLVVDATGAPRVPALDDTVAAITNELGLILAQLKTPLSVSGAVVSTGAGSVGLDYSTNQPALPPVANPSFAASGPYASFGLIKTVPAAPGRLMVELMNNSTAQIVVVRDDGTAAVGQAPVNASVFSILPAAVAGQSGGSWRSSTFKGRLQIYAASGAAQVAVMVD